MLLDWMTRIIENLTRKLVKATNKFAEVTNKCCILTNKIRKMTRIIHNSNPKIGKRCSRSAARPSCVSFGLVLRYFE